MAGEALDAVLRQYGPPPLVEALRSLSQLAEALDRAAGDGIHHGALHPRDILIAEGGDAHVVDIGVAQMLARCGLRVPVRRPYSAPERVEGEAWNGAADIFSLGAIAFELITGKRVAGPGRPSVSAAALTHVAAEDIAEALARALAADPAARYPSAADLVDALAPSLGARRTPVPPPRKRTRPEARNTATPLPLDAPVESRRAVPVDVPRVDELPETAASPAETLNEFPMLAPLPSDLTLREEEPPRFGDLDDSPAAIAADTIAAGEVRRDIGADLHGGHDLHALHAARDLRTGHHDPASELHAVHDVLDRGDAPDARPEAPFGSVLTAPPAVAAERRPLFLLIIALLVGISGGFGWGYWTAWRSQSRQASVAPPETPAAATEAAGSAEETSVRVDEPEVIGERGLPSPARSTPPAPAAPTPAAGARRAVPPPAAPRPSALPPGRLVVRSSPSGARVLVDGRVRGRTPLVLRDMPLRVLRITVDRQGFEPDERRVALSAAQPNVTVDATLQKRGPLPAQASTGMLVVDSRPPGARVILDGQDVGATPLSLPEVTPGTHRIRLELPGFNPWVTTAQITAGARTRVAASLERGTSQ